MEPLQTWWTTELYPTSDEDNFGVVGNFEVVKAADAQATIAALQARVNELEDGTTALLNQQSERLAVENEKLTMALSQLAQRTAELEAVSNFIGVQYDAESRTWVSGQAPYQSAGTTKQEACIAAVDALRLACATWEMKCRDLQAELEAAKGKLDIILRVSRGEPDDELAVDYGGLGWENDPAVLGVYNLIAELERVRGQYEGMLAMVKALPLYKDISVSHRINEHDYESWHVWADHNPLAECDTEEEANAIKALYEHRQGMEG